MKLFQSLLSTVVPLGCLLQTVASAVTFTNAPTAVSNTYGGFVTLSIGGLILAGGESSRLYQHLVKEKEVVTSIFAGIDGR